MPRATRAAAERTRISLLRTAASLFAERGFHAVSVGDVAGAVGVSRGAVYHNWADKTALFAEVVEHAHADAAERAAAAADGDDPIDVLVAGALAYVAACADDRHRRILLVDGPAVIDRARWAALEREYAASLLADALELADVDPMQRPAVSLLLAGAVQRAVVGVAEGMPLEALHAPLRAMIEATVRR
ncbi:MULTISPECIES: TetR/AcrR family transcriptional regulator [Microbacterium]|uniref:TetR/AcrR family transcriptional regulator n=1 Tax=Microbacterium TaxID=33882 RepID=UPI001E354C10|nr:TetR/AcrR family transcriptional regulator [Microbacterium nymphoidis]MCD2499180.1 TetR family transcriptional regulator [Microbacterium nymphoidis]